MNKKKKIIVLYSTGGMGHKKAAMAVFKAFKDKTDADIDVEIINVLDFASSIYKFLYLKLYVFLMSRGKLLWGALYYFSNIPFVDTLTRSVRGRIDSMGLPKLVPTLVEKNPDAIVATHFMLPSVAGILKKHKNFRSKLFTLVTDYGPHSFWLSRYIDRFFVGSTSVKQEMIKRDVPEDKIDVTGLPVGEEFRRKYDIAGLREKYGLEEGKKTIFLISGGFGVGPIGKILLSLNKCRAEIQVITVCGHNEKVYENIRLLEKKLKYKVVLFGFTDKVAELMSASDLMITKAGGISVTEALNTDLPMVMFASMPGQETWNEDFLLRNGAAVKAGKISDIPVVADKILLSPGSRRVFARNIEHIRKPRAADDIVDIVLEGLK
ncbi:MAG: glycosyltransferase [Candidatus Omnitrophota bacterium]